MTLCGPGSGDVAGLGPGVNYLGHCGNRDCVSRLHRPRQFRNVVCHRGYGIFRPREDELLKQATCPVCGTGQISPSIVLLRECRASVRQCLVGDAHVSVVEHEATGGRDQYICLRDQRTRFAMLVVEATRVITGADVGTHASTGGGVVRSQGAGRCGLSSLAQGLNYIGRCAGGCRGRSGQCGFGKESSVVSRGLGEVRPFEDVLMRRIQCVECGSAMEPLALAMRQCSVEVRVHCVGDDAVSGETLHTVHEADDTVFMLLSGEEVHRKYSMLVLIVTEPAARPVGTGEATLAQPAFRTLPPASSPATPLLQRTSRDCEETSQLSLPRVDVVVGDPDITEQRLERKQRLRQTPNWHTLHHATRETNAISILREEVFRPGSRPGFLGPGVYFCKSPHNAMKWCQPRTGCGPIVVLQCRAALGRILRVPRHHPGSASELLKTGHDSYEEIGRDSYMLPDGAQVDALSIRLV